MPLLLLQWDAYIALNECHRINFLLGPRQQLNQISSYIDASTVYDSSPEKSEQLRDNTDKGKHISTTESYDKGNHICNM